MVPNSRRFGAADWRVEQLKITNQDRTNPALTRAIAPVTPYRSAPAQQGPHRSSKAEQLFISPIHSPIGLDYLLLSR
jgi:hypothetical protein